MSAAALPPIRLPYPHAGQQVVRRQAGRFNWLAAGRRWRKTTMAMTISVEAAAAGQTVIWGAPTYNQVRIGMEETRRAAAGAADFNLSRMEVAFSLGGRILFRSLDNPDNSRGLTADGIVIDEAGIAKPYAWYEVLRPMLIDTGGWLWAIGTPNGRNWFWAESAAAAERADAMAWQVPTLGVEIVGGELLRKPHPLENPTIPFEEMRRLYRTMSERAFRQEILAEFVEDGAGIFRNVTLAATAPRQEGPEGGATYIAGLDWALSNDFTVLVILDATNRRVAYIDRFNGVDYSLQRLRIAAACARFGVISILAEENAMGKPNNDELRRMGLPVRDWTTTNTSKAEIVEKLAAGFEQGNVKIPNDPLLIAELQAFSAERLPGGMTRYSAPEGMHDDMVISLALAWYAATKPRRQASTMQG